MDGLFRITRHAENYYAYDDNRSTGRDLDFPTVYGNFDIILAFWGPFLAHF